MSDAAIREQLLDEALAHYLSDLDAGRAPNRSALIAQFPELAGYFAELDRMTPWIEPLQSVSRFARINESVTDPDTRRMPGKAMWSVTMRKWPSMPNTSSSPRTT